MILLLYYLRYWLALAVLIAGVIVQPDTLLGWVAVLAAAPGMVYLGEWARREYEQRRY